MNVFGAAAAGIQLNHVQLSDYHIERSIFESPGSSVFKARHVKTGRLVALKLRSTPELGSDWLHEAQLLSGLDHPGLVQCLGIASAPQGTYVVLEWAAGGTLADFLRALPRLPPSNAWREAVALAVLHQLAGAVAYLHSQGIVHRDLKPQNTLLMTAWSARSDLQPHDLVVKVADLGISREVGGGGTAAGATQDLHTFHGTPLYISPEMADGQQYSKPVDIWAMGVILFEMLSGKSPFARASLRGTLAAISKGDLPPMPAAASPGTAALLMDMLAVRASRRPSASDVLRRVASLIRTANTTPPHAPPPTTPPIAAPAAQKHADAAHASSIDAHFEPGDCKPMATQVPLTSRLQPPAQPSTASREGGQSKHDTHQTNDADMKQQQGFASPHRHRLAAAGLASSPSSGLYPARACSPAPIPARVRVRVSRRRKQQQQEQEQRHKGQGLEQTRQPRSSTPPGLPSPLSPGLNPPAQAAFAQGGGHARRAHSPLIRVKHRAQHIKKLPMQANQPNASPRPRPSVSPAPPEGQPHRKGSGAAQQPQSRRDAPERRMMPQQDRLQIRSQGTRYKMSTRDRVALRRAAGRLGRAVASCTAECIARYGLPSAASPQVQCAVSAAAAGMLLQHRADLQVVHSAARRELVHAGVQVFDAAAPAAPFDSLQLPVVAASALQQACLHLIQYLPPEEGAAAAAAANPVWGGGRQHMPEADVGASALPIAGEGKAPIGHPRMPVCGVAPPSGYAPGRAAAAHERVFNAARLHMFGASAQ